MEIEKIRAEIDDVDSQIAKLFERRVKLVAQVAVYKRASAKPILDQGREKLVLDNVTSSCDAALSAEITELYGEIMRLSRSYQARLAKEQND